MCIVTPIVPFKRAMVAPDQDQQTWVNYKTWPQVRACVPRASIIHLSTFTRFDPGGSPLYFFFEVQADITTDSPSSRNSTSRSARSPVLLTLFGWSSFDRFRGRSRFTCDLYMQGPCCHVSPDMILCIQSTCMSPAKVLLELVHGIVTYFHYLIL